MTATGLEPQTTKFVNEHSTIWPKWPNDWALFWVLICTMHLTVCFCHVTCAFQSEFTLYSCLNVEELLAWSWREIWSLSDCNWPHSEDSLWNAYVTWQEHTLYWQYLQKSWRSSGMILDEGTWVRLAARINTVYSRIPPTNGLFLKILNET